MQSQGLDHLKPFATKRQLEIIEAVEKYENKTIAAKKLGINGTSLYRAIKSAKNRYKAKLGLTGDYVGATSTLIKGGENDDFALRWIKASDKDLATNREAALKGFLEQLPREPRVKKTAKTYNKKLINQYTITDFHLGMLSWAGETGADWDTEIAVNTLVKWFSVAIKSSPDAEECLFVENGDFEHYDGLDSVTPMHKHVLDADSRQHKLIRASIQVNRAVIKMLLKKYKKVNVIISEGNHNLSSSAWRRESFRVIYENEPRVYINPEVKPYYAHEHGKTALFFSHGHVKKMDQIDRTFAGLFPELFGRTKHRYAHMGHFHHDKVIETSLMKVEQHRTLAAPDAYAVRGGYLSGRDAKVITYHKDFGEVSRLVIGFDML